MTIGAALFDLDGTLADTLPLCYVAFSPVARSIARPALSDAEIHALCGPSEDGMMRRVLPDAGPRPPISTSTSTPGCCRRAPTSLPRSLFTRAGELLAWRETSPRLP